LLFEEMGLGAIEVHPSRLVLLHGPPGCGKSAVAEAMAEHLRRQVIEVTYASLIDCYFGESEKNIQALFAEAARAKAVVVFNEADALAGKRVAVRRGSDSFHNSTKSQLLVELERFTGLVVMTSNFPMNFDAAMMSRVQQIAIPLPDHAGREQIWALHLPAKLPRAKDVTPAALASASEGFGGRDIKKTVIMAVTRAARLGRQQVALADFLDAIAGVRADLRVAERLDEAKS
jgi:SpoVK/Ycf46/Vps4 family AAA+-type ATPase